MAKTFRISPANPIPFTKIVTLDPTYNTFAPHLQRTPKTINGCYYQKWELLDTTKVQFLTDYDVTVKVYRNTGVLVATLVPVEIATNIVGYTFKCYEVEYDFSAFGNGYFYSEITFIDEDGAENVYQSEIWQTADKWPDTLAWDYKNVYNKFDLVFDKGYNPRFRIESKIDRYSPDADSSVYIDQEHNPYLLGSIPFDRYQLRTDFAPDWALRIFNFVLNVSEKKADGQLYEKPTDAKLEITRAEGYDYGYANIELIPVVDFFLNNLIIGDDMAGEYVLLTKRLQWIDNAVNRTITGKFRVNSVLRRIDIINKSASSFTVKIGITDGGNELGEKEVTSEDPSATLLCLHPFVADTTVYITGIAGVTTNLFIIFDQDDEVALPINGSGGSGGGLFPKGTLGFWEEVEDGDIEAVWDLGSGLGKPNTRYSNCAICDGRNGTNDYTDTYLTGVAIADIETKLNTSIGSNQTTLAIANLPKHKFRLFKNTVGGADLDSEDPVSYQKNSGINRDYVMAKSPGGQPTLGSTNEVGGDTPFTTRPKSQYVIIFKAITD